MAYEAAFQPFDSPRSNGATHRSVAPLLPVQRAWLRTWSVQLDPRRHPSVSGASVVSSVLRSVPAREQDDEYRSLAAWPAPTQARPVRRFGAAALEPRSMGGHPGDAGAPRRRTVELLAALSGGLDAAEDRPLGHAVRTAVIAVHIATAMERGEATRSTVLYGGLLRDAGTTGRTAAAGSGKGKAPSRNQPTYLSRPNRAAAVIRTLGLSAEVADAVCSADEQWNGKGPMHARKDAIPVGARILAVASAAALAVAEALRKAAASGSTELAAPAFRAVDSALRSQRGHQLDPAIVDACIKTTPTQVWKQLVESDPMDQLLEAEPAGDIRRSTPEHVDTVCATFADLVDTRTPIMGRHGVRVAELAERVAIHLNFDDLESRELRRAGLLHDIGKLLVPIAYLEKAAELTPAERAVIQDHPRVGAEILRRSRIFAGLAQLVVCHHERLDGEGTFPEFHQPRMALAARILAICDRYEAMTSERPYRPLLTTDQVWRLLEEAATEPLARQAFHALREVVKGV